MENNSINILSLFSNNPIFNVLTLVLAVGSLVLAVYFYFKGKKVKLPVYILKTNNLVTESIKNVSSVQILYNNNKISNLSVTKIALWNEGKDTIDNADVAKSDPIKIMINPSFEILEAEILYSKNAANDFKLALSEDKKFVEICFDFFDYEEGIVIQLFHTASSSDDIYVTGKVKSVKTILRKKYSRTLLPLNILRILFVLSRYPISTKLVLKTTGWTMSLLGILMTLVLFIRPDELLFQVNQTDSLWLSKILLAFVGLFYTYVGFQLLKRTIPKGFDIFNEGISSI